jgi:hypothetical protein
MNGICEYRGYTFWHHVEVVEEKIWDYLELTFPDRIIFPELFGADFVIMGENIPVEVQSTIILNYNKNRPILAHSQFEMMIEKQIKQNCSYFGKCWLFIDQEYLNYLQKEITRNARINYDWLYQLIKEEKVKVFTIDYNGDIKNTSYNEFKFIKNISRTCRISQDDDYRLLDQNKFDIINSLLRGYEYSCDELFSIRKKYDATTNIPFLRWLRRKGSSSREMLLGNIMYSVSMLNFINNILDLNGKEAKLTRNNKQIFSLLGLFRIIGATSGSAAVFEDKFAIARYFPGYIRNSELWNSLKDKSIMHSTLKNLINNEIGIDQIDELKTELNRERKEILREKLLELNNFTKDELKLHKEEFEKDTNEKIRSFQTWLLRTERSNRQKILGNILLHSTRTELIESFFGRIENNDEAKFRSLKEALNHLKIIESKKGGSHTKIKYMDKFELSCVFDGFEKNKFFWDSIKGKSFNNDQFWDLVYNRNMEQLDLGRFG